MRTPFILLGVLGAVLVAALAGTHTTKKQPPHRDSRPRAVAAGQPALDQAMRRKAIPADTRMSDAARAHAGADEVVEYSVLASSDPEKTPPPFTVDDVTTTDATRAEVAPPAPKRQRFDDEQDRYLREVVAPRARACWKQLDGQGLIEFLYLMRHETGTGAGAVTPTTDIGIDTPVSVVASELTPAQSKRALECMLDAVEGTSFTAELPNESLGPLVGVYQVWHVGKRPDAK